MIVATLRLAENKAYKGFTVEGHSYNAPKGRDIICAAVSAIVQTALIGLDETAQIKNTYRISDGFIDCELPDKISDKDKYSKAQTIINVMHLGLTSIARQYNDFVCIKEEQ